MSYKSIRIMLNQLDMDFGGAVRSIPQCPAVHTAYLLMKPNRVQLIEMGAGMGINIIAEGNTARITDYLKQLTGVKTHPIPILLEEENND